MWTSIVSLFTDWKNILMYFSIAIAAIFIVSFVVKYKNTIEKVEALQLESAKWKDNYLQSKDAFLQTKDQLLAQIHEQNRVEELLLEREVDNKILEQDLVLSKEILDRLEKENAEIHNVLNVVIPMELWCETIPTASGCDNKSGDSKGNSPRNIAPAISASQGTK
jgi:septal ring factor EnvC (AmiA/AmiB activator)